MRHPAQYYSDDEWEDLLPMPQRYGPDDESYADLEDALIGYDWDEETEDWVPLEDNEIDQYYKKLDTLSDDDGALTLAMSFF